MVPLRDIGGVLERRGDMSPYLVHLTKDAQDSMLVASVVLEAIIQERNLWPGSTEVSAIKYGGYTADMDIGERRRFFGAICFTETPLDQLQAMIQIQGAGIRLSRYGLVFSKAALARKKVQPAYYLNNELGNKDMTVQTLFGLIGTAPDVAIDFIDPLQSMAFNAHTITTARERLQRYGNAA